MRFPEIGRELGADGQVHSVQCTGPAVYGADEADRSDCPNCLAMASFVLNHFDPEKTPQASIIKQIGTQKLLGMRDETLEELAAPWGVTKQAIDASAARTAAELPGPFQMLKNLAARRAYAVAAKEAWKKRKRKTGSQPKPTAGQVHASAKMEEPSLFPAKSTTEGQD